MRIENIQPVVTYKGDEMIKKVENNTGFADLLRQTIQEVNQTQKVADATAEAFALGKIDNVHAVTIASEQAKLALEMTIAVRNKVVEAYKEIMRLQF